MRTSKQKRNSETKNARVLARVVKELDLARRIPEPVLILNSSCLSDIPAVVLRDEHCSKHLKELCLKNNRIQCLVNDAEGPRLSGLGVMLAIIGIVPCSQRHYQI